MREVSQSRFAALVPARKACRLCSDLVNPAECEDGRYDSEQIGPWSLWQGNIEAEMMIVGQDWGDTRYWIDNKGHEKAGNRTNEMLIKLLGSIGINVRRPALTDLGGGAVFATNELRGRVPEADHRLDTAEGAGVARRVGL